MIVKTKQGHQVLSEKGKPLSKPNLTLEEAKQRLREVEYYKKKKWYNITIKMLLSMNNNERVGIYSLFFYLFLYLFIL